MNKLMNFKNKDFIDIRSMKINGEIWFVAKDIARNLGYKDQASSLKRHVDEDDRGVGEIPTPGGIQKMRLINESGLYSLILGSKLQSSKRFKKWVTSEVLPSIRQNGTYETKKTTEEIMIYQLEEQKKIKEQLNQVNCRALKLESKFDDLPLLAIDSSELTTLAKRKIVSLLGGKGAPAYKVFNRKAFSDLYHELHRQFDVNKICAIKRKDLDDAKRIVSSYLLPMKLKGDIEVTNNQMKIVI
ncbi:BRO family protein [uncultured Clostridium sp.]|uniref:BRO family protein n=1 Tax=uncultured Clostridium sp. TaxID=59620 RepID=UPI002602D25E|nr:BRO family protein [uncultured Clostridium sp.]